MIILLIAMCLCALIAATALNEGDDPYANRLRIPARAKTAIGVGSIFSVLILLGIGWDLVGGGIKPYGKMAFRQGRFVPIQKFLDYDEMQHAFPVRYEEYSFWGYRKKGEWPARWAGDDEGWQVYRNQRWVRIIFDSGDDNGYDTDNRGTYSR